MSVETLGELNINTDQNLVGKDGSDLQNVKQANIGTPGGAFITMKDGKITMYDSSGNIVVLLNPNG